ncbi:MAG: hypothetical protein E6579_11655 [Clostridium sp.]|nr:hypothetical protein [Clostridium sp.]
MADKKYVDFLDKLINLTANEKLDWEYLDSNLELASKCGLGIRDGGIIRFTLPPVSGVAKIAFNTEDSYFLEIDTNYIILYRDLESVTLIDSLHLRIVPSTFKGILNLSEEYDDKVLLLRNTIVATLPNADAVMEDILSM